MLRVSILAIRLADDRFSQQPNCNVDLALSAAVGIKHETLDP